MGAPNDGPSKSSESRRFKTSCLICSMLCCASCRHSVLRLICPMRSEKDTASTTTLASTLSTSRRCFACSARRRASSARSASCSAAAPSACSSWSKSRRRMRLTYGRRRFAAAWSAPSTSMYCAAGRRRKAASASPLLFRSRSRSSIQRSASSRCRMSPSIFSRMKSDSVPALAPAGSPAEAAAAASASASALTSAKTPPGRAIRGRGTVALAADGTASGSDAAGSPTADAVAAGAVVTASGATAPASTLARSAGDTSSDAPLPPRAISSARS